MLSALQQPARYRLFLDVRYNMSLNFRGGLISTTLTLAMIAILGCGGGSTETTEETPAAEGETTEETTTTTDTDIVVDDNDDDG
jgi:hypothetical protein